MTGFVYLLHFDRPLNGFSHYVGWTKDVEKRIEAHRAGRGAILTRRLKRAGIGFQLARTWPGDRKLEHQLKRQKQARMLCPVCKNN